MITWTTDCNAPCCPGQIVNDNGRTILVQTDWDYPGVASTFGWSVRNVQHVSMSPDPCGHNGTDGTVDCPACGVTASEFISAARDYLDENDGAVAEDPGYFPVERTEPTAAEDHACHCGGAS